MSDLDDTPKWIIKALHAICDKLNANTCGYHSKFPEFMWDVQYGKAIARPKIPRAVAISLAIGRACFCPDSAPACKSSPKCGEVFACRTYPIAKTALDIRLVFVPKDGDPREFIESTENESYTPDLDELTWKMMLSRQSRSEITNAMNNYYNDLAVAAARRILNIWDDTGRARNSPDWNDVSEAIVREQVTETLTRCCRDMDDVDEMIDGQD